MTSGIYKIESMDGTAYIGSAINIEKRWYQHRWYLNKNKHGNAHLQRAWNKYGCDYFIFSIIELVEGAQYLLEREQYWIDYSKTIQRLYNIAEIAGRGPGTSPHRVYRFLDPLDNYILCNNLPEFCRNSGLNYSRMAHVARANIPQSYNGFRSISKEICYYEYAEELFNTGIDTLYTDTGQLIKFDDIDIFIDFIDKYLAHIQISDTGDIHFTDIHAEQRWFDENDII